LLVKINLPAGKNSGLLSNHLRIVTPMKIEHLAIWVEDLEKMRAFYAHYFQLISGEKYHNPTKHFQSYFLRTEASAARLELMHRPDVALQNGPRGQVQGLAHFAISVGSKAAVDQLTERLRTDGYTIAGEPRTTGDGYYESVVLDPEGNLVEITE
jgi:lactoylglutathione lyase